MQLSQQTVLIIGGATGIGLAIAERVKGSSRGLNCDFGFLPRDWRLLARA